MHCLAAPVALLLTGICQKYAPEKSQPSSEPPAAKIQAHLAPNRRHQQELCEIFIWRTSLGPIRQTEYPSA